MSTPNPNSTVERILSILTTANAAAPIAIGGVKALMDLFKGNKSSGKTDAEIEAQWQDSMATALRTREKKNKQMGDQP